MKILGIDPGSHATGYGIVSMQGAQPELLEYGCIQTRPKAPVAQRLFRIYDSLSKLLQDKKVDAVSIEEAFYAKNVKTTLALGQARGVILLASHQLGAKIFEYSPREIKKAATGNGAASKEQVQRMLQSIFAMSEVIEPADASDAVAAAYCHATRAKWGMT